MEFLSSPELASQAAALGQVLLMDLVLAGDNAVAVGLAAAALPQDQRKKAILIGLAAAVVMRIGFALITVQLLALVGLLLAGGLLLLWVCWKMWRELREQATHDQAEAEAELQLALSIEHGTGPSPEELGVKRKSFGAALIQIMVADITMSLDNVLAVAGAAHEHPWIMVFGLILSIALMGVAATYIAKLLHRFSWIGYIGLVVVLYVALHMIWDGARQVVVRTGHLEQFNASAPAFLEIGPEEAAKHLGQKRTADSPVHAPAQPTAPAR
ncbi:TerC family protein [uncultured Brevundimonas sp.]|uniref:TerC family protein n=1 Tax=uncultured Brevundimonas sp. TaxID=213418 RepID=UPI0025DFE35C|nr:TerC family protein [uncultured Brevundimonas sp.]